MVVNWSTKYIILEAIKFRLTLENYLLRDHFKMITLDFAHIAA